MEAFGYFSAYFARQKNMNLQPNLFGDRQFSEISQLSH